MMRRGTIVAIAYVVAMAALGMVAGWPIYGTPTFLLVAGAASIVGIGLALVATKLSWQWWIVALALVGALFALGLGLAVPHRWASGAVFPHALVDIVTAPLLGWKDLVTSPVPVGTYRNLLVPAIVVFLLGTFFATKLGIREDGRAAVAVPVAALMPAFGLFFGRTATSAPIAIGPVTLSAPVEMATGALSVLLSVLWLAWRAREQRRAALRRAADATGVTQTRSVSPAAAVRRGSLAVGMIAAATAIGLVVTPAMVDTRKREVLRTAIGPDLSVTEALSPLSTYRERFRDASYDAVLFRVTSEKALPERIRLATLDWYDGEVYRAAEQYTAFQRVPSRLPATAGETSTVRFDIETYDSVWLPTFGSLQQVTFRGPSATDLADRFYYDESTGTAVEAGGLAAGESYDVRASVAAEPDLDGARSLEDSPSVKIPENMQRWMDKQKFTRDGAGVMTAIDRLRARGYLSHSLTIDAETTPKWLAQMPGDYTFRTSAAGHSLARIDVLFSQMLERETQVDSDEDAELVAAVGDEEQFATAAALIAQQLGFPSRVVVGVRTSHDELPACDNGVCTGSDIAAWIEVKTADGWVTMDTTPQAEQRVQTQTSRQRDPENMTDVRPETASEVAPPDPNAADLPSPQPPKPDPNNFSQFWEIARWVGIGALGLLVLLGPALLVLIAKLLRRKRRQSDPDRARAIAGGWEEYVDAAVDTGKQVPGNRTRSEVAAEYATPQSAHLATLADAAVFSDETPDDAEAAQFWQIVSQERRALRSEIGWWHRIRAALSLTSFRRHIVSRTQRAGASRATRRTERRQHRSSDA